MKSLKKFIWLFILFMPFLVKADIPNYRIDATVLDNGDLLVKEVFNLSGEYNGFERKINYKNDGLKGFDGSLESLNGSDIYNGSAIELIGIRAVDNELDSFSNLTNSGDLFKEAVSANPGEYGVYIKSDTINGVAYKIFNPSSKNKAFYLEYKIKNLAISHNDVSEIGWNIFDSLTEDIINLEVGIHIPNNKEILRAWAHGPLTGNIEIKDKENFNLTLKGMYANEKIDTRFVFDKEYLKDPNKISNIAALDNIIKLETKKADAANKERAKARKIDSMYGIINATYMVILIVLVFTFYYRHDKEVKTTFNQKYLRDFPSEATPASVGYLFNKKISSKELSASIMELIDLKVIEASKTDKKDYLFTLKKDKETLTSEQKKLVEFLFVNESQIALSSLKKSAKKSYEDFLNRYKDWEDEALATALNKEYFETNRNTSLYILYCLLGLVIGGYSIYKHSDAFTFNYNLYLGVASIILAIFSMIYIAKSSKRTPSGALEFVKWKALKNFLNDFSIIDKRELPEIALWGKYLVYAVVLGCASKLAKDMQIRVKEFDQELTDINTFTTTDFIMFNSINNTVSSSINSAIATARSTQSIANSANSSGGGFGGGFSGGGGSFGGGGGGGRF